MPDQDNSNFQAMVQGRPGKRQHLHRALDSDLGKSDNPTMRTVTADQKRRVSLPDARPGDVFGVRKTPESNYVLEKLVRQSTPDQSSAAEVRAAMEAGPLEPRVGWDELRKQTREACFSLTPMS